MLKYEEITIACVISFILQEYKNYLLHVAFECASLIFNLDISEL